MTATNAETSTDKYYHVKVRKNTNEEFYELNLQRDTVLHNVVHPYFEGSKILLGGMIIDAADVERLQVYLTVKTSYEIIDNYRKYRNSFRQSSPEPDYSDNWFITDRAIDVTQYFINSILYTI